MIKNKRTITVFGLSILSIILVIILVVKSQPEKETDEMKNYDMAAGYVDIREIEIAMSTMVVPEIILNEIQHPEPTIELMLDAVSESEPEPTLKTEVIDISLTVIEEKPEPPEIPDTGIGQDLTDPDKKPDDVTIHPVEKTKPTQPPSQKADKTITKTPVPTDSTPKGNSKNNNGEVYVEGFGWIKSGGDNIGEVSSSDGDWNKQIGNMN